MSRDVEQPDGPAIIELPDEDLVIRDPEGVPLTARRPQLGPASPFRVRPSGEVRPARELRIARRPDSFAAQQYRLLRHSLREAADPRLIGVTSPLPGEGKTVTAANLGLALAEGRRVRIMLLDMNLRHPRLATLFGLDPPGGVTEQLQRKQRDFEATWDVLELGSRLHLMGGSHNISNPAALLNSNEVAALMTDLAEHYDFVVADLPPVLNAADVKILQEQLDCLVLVVKTGVSSRGALHTSINQLGRDKIAGVLLRNVQERYIPR